MFLLSSRPFSIFFLWFRKYWTFFIIHPSFLRCNSFFSRICFHQFLCPSSFAGKKCTRNIVFAICTKQAILLWLWEKLRNSSCTFWHPAMNCHGWQFKSQTSHGRLVWDGCVTLSSALQGTHRISYFRTTEQKNAALCHLRHSVISALFSRIPNAKTAGTKTPFCTGCRTVTFSF